MAPISSGTFFVSTMGMIFVVLINWLIPAALLCVLQYFLSKMESPWPGRVLPILSGSTALLLILFLVFNAINFVRADWVWLVVLLVGLLSCIPTVLFIIIYRRTRQNLIIKKNMEKMNIQDLE